MKNQKQQIEVVKQWVMALVNEKEKTFEEIHESLYKKGKYTSNKELFNDDVVPALVTFHAVTELVNEKQLHKLEKTIAKPEFRYTTSPISTTALL